MNMTKYTGTFYDLETEIGLVKTNLRETPKLEMQTGYTQPYWTRQRVADTIADLLIEGYITEEVFTNFINRYPDELL
jgi:hypothetical protein